MEVRWKMSQSLALTKRAGEKKKGIQPSKHHRTMVDLLFFTPLKLV